MNDFEKNIMQGIYESYSRSYQQHHHVEKKHICFSTIIKFSTITSLNTSIINNKVNSRGKMIAFEP
jgi:hypothetical protein